ncbi:GTP-binding protein [Marinobacter sp. NP-4(2019)]|uniref:CobW family GTP-binding protein n=1 Tax=Marinobacter sp. NP-4(2019) TaxID=2488665 RepID=UPI000FC3CA26|nr:GTP-binding protein [Marinobacter sp. NP-4(2019)]AZT83191.1 GTP-binding protein [Marinobacter sp. NP-4(2019)]
MKTPIPTNLILGFLGVGKTTAILDLLNNRPEGEVWAVLVNEFGEVGIDGALLETEGAFVREIPGGCMCCVAGLPMQIGLNQLIHKARPDRLLIEPTGLGHPSQIIDTLTSEHYQDVLALGPVIGLVDPRRLDEPRVVENVQFRDQVAAADILVANKVDTCSPEQLSAFDRWAAALKPAKRAIRHTSFGRLAPEWLDGNTDLPEVTEPQAHHHHDHRTKSDPAASITDEPWQRVSNEGQGYFSVGWRIHPDLVLDENGLLALAFDDRLSRCKAVVHCTDGWRAVNMADGALSVVETEAREMSRIEIIAPRALDADEFDQLLRAASSGPRDIRGPGFV